MIRDKNNILEKNNITLLGKWAPTEYSSKDNKYNLVKTICNHCDITPRIYRKKYISPLRKTLKIVERSIKMSFIVIFFSWLIPSKMIL